MHFQKSLLIAMVMCITPSYAQDTLPAFSGYPISETEVFKGNPKPVNLSSYAGARTFRTKLREGAALGPNFAGHYTVVTFGCGTQCQENWIIDAESGKILDRFSSNVGTLYQLDSLLMVVNPPDPQLKKAYEKHPEQPVLGTMDTTYEVLENNKFKTIYKDKWVNVIKVLP